MTKRLHPMRDDDMNCFVSRCKCGAGLCFAAVDDPKHRKNNANEVAKMIRRGYRVDNMPLSEVRNSKFCFCEAKKPKTKKPSPTAELF